MGDLQELVELGVMDSYKVVDFGSFEHMPNLARDTDSEAESDKDTPPMVDPASDVEEASAGSEKEESPKPKGKKKKGNGRKTIYLKKKAKRSSGLAKRRRTMLDRVVIKAFKAGKPGTRRSFLSCAGMFE